MAGGAAGGKELETLNASDMILVTISVVVLDGTTIGGPVTVLRIVAGVAVTV